MSILKGKTMIFPTSFLIAVKQKILVQFPHNFTSHRVIIWEILSEIKWGPSLPTYVFRIYMLCLALHCFSSGKVCLSVISKHIKTKQISHRHSNRSFQDSERKTSVFYWYQCQSYTASFTVIINEREIVSNFTFTFCCAGCCFACNTSFYEWKHTTFLLLHKNPKQTPE